MKLKSTIRTRKQHGIAMMVAMLALLLLAAIGMGLMFMADTENSINNNYRDAQKAYFAARAGAENVRVLLAPKGPLNAAASLMDGSMPDKAANTGVIYVLNPTSAEAIDPTGNLYVDDELCQEQYVNLGLTVAPGPCTASTQLIPSTSFTTIGPPTLTSLEVPGVGGTDALAFKWVRITNKQNMMGLLSHVDPTTGTLVPQTVDGTTTQNGLQVCWDGNKEFTIPAGSKCSLQNPLADPVWLLTSLAVTPKIGQNPGSRRMVQMEVALTPPLVPQAPISTEAPVTLAGSYVVNAYDSCTCTCTTDAKGNTTCGGAGCYNQAHAVLTAGTVSQLGNSGSTIANPTFSSPYLQNVNPWPYNIDQLINQYSASASKPSWSSSCTGTANFFSIPPVYANCGTQTNQVFGTFPSGMLLNPPVEPDPTTLNSVTEYIPGSVHLSSGTNGSGILIVDGDLQLDGGMNWYGLILVRGQVTFTGGAGGSNNGNVNLFGSILAGQDVTATNQTLTSVDGDKFGGSINFHYDVCALKSNGGTRPPRLLATHELSF